VSEREVGVKLGIHITSSDVIMAKESVGTHSEAEGGNVRRDRKSGASVLIYSLFRGITGRSVGEEDPEGSSRRSF